jgi:RNA recognition motif-containing protein
LVIEYDSITNQYNTKQGWVAISSIPIFQIVSSQWYYSCKESEEKNKNEVETAAGKRDNENRSSSSSSCIKGPISCRELASLYYKDVSVIKDDTTRFWSASINSCIETKDEEEEKAATTNTKWKLLSEVPLLRVALEAFEDIVNLSIFTTDNDELTSNILSSQAPTNNFQYNVEDMIYNDQKDEDVDEKNEIEEHESLLHDFFSSTSGDAPHLDHVNNNDEEDEEEEYESDGGTQYIKFNNQWIDAKAVPKSAKKIKKRDLPSTFQHPSGGVSEKSHPTKKKKKNKKAKFSSKHSKNWIYVTNLPTDTSESEVASYFSKVGILDIDPETQKAKVKLYRNSKVKNGNTNLKGDASICYAKIESVHLAIQLLDDTIFRTIDPNTKKPCDYDITKQKKLCVQQAKFEQKTDSKYISKNVKNKSSISDRKRQVARLAKLQAITWDEGDYNGRITGGLKGLRIIVLKHAFTLKDIQRSIRQNKHDGEDLLLESIEQKVRKQCEQFGVVEKITIFSKNADGVVVVKFSQPSSASDTIAFYRNDNDTLKNIEASYWDGVTDYTVRDEVQEQEENEKRLDDFGNWLNEQELPDEFQLNVES